ncbi:MAG TPA: SDR family oxidoreductase [Nitrososphaerales archaeon]|nr:SDR family oxidoreductase [Nitrososphaerales archaeon]
MLSSGLSGQRILVTASSSGIGFGAARAFLEEGASVVINSSNPAKLDEALNKLKPLGKVHKVVADLTRRGDIDRLVNEAATLLGGGIDTLVYVTGSPPPGTFLDQDYEDWESGSKLLLVSAAYVAKKVSELMITTNTKGRLVFLTSTVIREPSPTLALSNVCRISVAGLVRTLARELGPKGIRVNGILPGWVRTPRVDQIARDTAKRRGITEEQAISEIEGQIPLGHIASPAELARTIVFLGSEMSSYVTGAMIPVDGGVLRSVG